MQTRYQLKGLLSPQGGLCLSVFKIIGWFEDEQQQKKLDERLTTRLVSHCNYNIRYICSTSVRLCWFVL